MNVDYRKYALFTYNSTTSPNDDFRLGDVVKKTESGEIGVIIQVHAPDDFRTDCWGNCSSSEIVMAKDWEVVNLKENDPEPEKPEPEEPLGYWEARERVAEQMAMDNKPYEDTHESY